jgi:lipopolysaccharide/colanic/teichoic acid biosynthesis glycosyltransferase
MKQEILTQFPWPVLPMIALVIFFTFFILLMIRVSLKSQQPVFDVAATLPLHEGEKYEKP